MTRSYTDTQIRNALQVSGGNVAKARQYLVDKMQEDSQLLFDMTHPHLGGIVSYAIDRFIRMQSRPSDAPPPSSPVTPQMNATEMGTDILKNVMGSSGRAFGKQSVTGIPEKKKQASQQHINAINMIAKKLPGTE